MKLVQGTIDCKDTKSIPVGSVIFIHVYKEKEVVGRQTLQSVEHFPFEYKVEVDDRHLATSGNFSLRVTVENGEQTLFLNGTNGHTEVAEDKFDERFDVTLNSV